nr:MAG TPA: hypothetical protein [Caudoviricetes sp.]
MISGASREQGSFLFCRWKMSKFIIGNFKPLALEI